MTNITNQEYEKAVKDIQNSNLSDDEKYNLLLNLKNEYIAQQAISNQNGQIQKSMAKNNKATNYLKKQISSAKRKIPAFSILTYFKKTHQKSDH